MKWDKRFIELAYLVASWSKDNSTKCGAVIVDENKRIVSVGFNGFPKNTNDDEKLYDNREEKYRRIIHAEQNCLAFSYRDVTGFTLYCTHCPCAQCAAMVVQRGICRVVFKKPTKEFLSRWGSDIRISLDMFKEANVEMCFYKEQ